METQILINNNNEISNTGVQPVAGLLSIGENVNLYVVDSKLPTDSGEAEIYICKKDNQKYILKYYFNCRPKTEVIEKLKGFKNPDIVTLYEFGEYKEHFYEVIEYAEGGSLDCRNSDGSYKYLPVNEETAIQIVKETVNAFNECHKAGIIHRDIKPGNLFYKNKDGTDLLVGDFGISSYYDVDDGMSKHLTQSTARTEGYTAPEVYTGIIGPEIDYYSLGVTLWELLTAKDPFMTIDGKPMFTASIILETTQGKMIDNLLARAPNLSKKMKTLIKGLMTHRHDKRWNYEKVTNFLNGEEVAIYEEVNQLPSVKVGEIECISYKEIASAILSDFETGKNFVYKGNLARYLVKINKDLANEVADEMDAYSAKGNLDEGLYYIAHKLCPNLEFKLSEKTTVSSITEIQKVLETKPREILPYLKDESKNFYLFLKVIGLEEVSKKIFEIVKSSKNEFLMITKISLALDGNCISPFTDGINDKIVLSDIKQLQVLSDSLKNRLLLKIDAYDRNICAWIENQTGINIEDWRKSFSEVEYPMEDMVFSKWDLFNSFIVNDNSFVSVSDEEKLVRNLKFFKEKQNYKLLNLIIDKTWNSLFEKGKYETCFNILDFISTDTEGLSNDYDFYLSKKGQCLYEMRKYHEALQLLESLKESSFIYKYCALCSYKLKENAIALDYLNKAINKVPDDCVLYNLKGKILYESKEYKEAAAAFSMAIDIKECREFYHNRAKCYDKLAIDGAPKLKEKAEKDRESASNIDPTDFSFEFEKDFSNRKKLSEYKNIVTVGTSIDCNYDSIQQAIDSVSEGATIHVLPGTYKENLNFTKSVNLVGCEYYIADKSSEELPVVVFDKEYSCKVDVPVNIGGIVFSQNQNIKFSSIKEYTNDEIEVDKPDNSGSWGEDNFQTVLWLNAECKLSNIAVFNGENYGITFTTGTSVLEYSFVSKTKDNGIYCVETSSPKIERTNISNCYFPNVYLKNSTTAKFADCNIYSAFDEGVCLNENSSGKFTGCEIYDNGDSGIHIEGDGTSTTSTIESCEIFNNNGSGIDIIYATPTIENCKIHDNENVGIDCAGESKGTVTNCEIYDNKGNGILIKEYATPTIENCKIHDNKTEGKNYPGVVARGDSTPVLKNCEIYKHLANGILIKENATPTIENCKIHDNKTEGENYPGVVARGDSAPVLKNCEIYKHLSYGIWIKENAGGRYENCKIHDNKGQGIKNESSKSVDTSSCKCWSNG